jgi:hypothetical protein
VTKLTLAEWLTQLREDDEIEASYTPVYEEDDDEDEEPPGRRAVWSFPSDDALDEFVATIDERSQGEIDLVLRHLLIPLCLLGKDYEELEAYLQLRERDDPGLEEVCRSDVAPPTFSASACVLLGQDQRASLRRNALGTSTTS